MAPVARLAELSVVGEVCKKVSVEMVIERISGS